MKKSKNNALGAAGVIMMIFSFFMRPTATAPSGMPPPDYLSSHMSEAEVEWYKSLSNEDTEYIANIYEYGKTDGYDSGYKKGHENGYSEGYDYGHSISYQSGYSAGYNARDIENKSVPANAPVTAPDTENVTVPSDSQGEETVWIGATGTKYHRYSCPTLKSTHREITLSEALAQGREPCKVCKP